MRARPPRRWAPTTRASTCCARRRRDYVLELNGIPGWHGLQEATGADVAAALVAHLEAVVSGQLAPPDDAAVQRGGDERAGRAGVARARAGRRRRARRRRRAARASGKRGVELGDQRDVRSRAAADAREVEHDRLAQPGAVQPRERVERRQAARAAGRARAARPSRRSRLRTTAPPAAPRAAGRARRRRPASRCRRRRACTPSSSSARARSGSLTPGVDHHARLARQRGDDASAARRPPAIASRSAT